MRVVVDHQTPSGIAPDDVDVEIVERARRMRRHRNQFDRPVFALLEKGALQVEHDRHERNAQRIAGRVQHLHEPVERQHLMRERPVHHVARGAGVVGQRRRRIDVEPQHQRVGEDPDQRFQIDLVAARDLDREAHVLPPGIALQRDRKGGGTERKDRGFERLRGFAEPGLEIPRQIGGITPAFGLLRGARPVGRQLEIAHALQPALPVRLFLGKGSAGFIIGLPQGEIAVLQRKLRQHRGLARFHRLEEGPKLVAEHPDRIAVEDRVVHRDEQGRALRLDLHHRDPDQPGHLQIEGFLGRLDGNLPDLPVAVGRGHVADVEQVQLEIDPCDHLLHRLAVAFDEPGPEDLVAVDDPLKRGLDRGRGHGAAQLPAHGNVEPAVPGMDLLHEPGPFLRDRGGESPDDLGRAGRLHINHGLSCARNRGATKGICKTAFHALCPERQVQNCSHGGFPPLCRYQRHSHAEMW